MAPPGHHGTGRSELTLSPPRLPSIGGDGSHNLPWKDETTIDVQTKFGVVIKYVVGILPGVVTYNLK